MEPGVTVVAGENASNKSSLLAGLGAVLGGRPPTLRGGADDGVVALDLAGERFELVLDRGDGETVVADATPYTTSSTLVELFAHLGERNPIRRAVREGGDLHDLLMRPVDTASIDAEIDRLRTRRDELDDRLASLDDRIDDLPELEVRARRLTEERDEVTTRLEAARSALGDVDYRGVADAVRDRLDALSEAREERERLRDRRDTKRRAVESLREELAEVEERLATEEANGESVEARLDAVEADLTALRERKGRLDETINALSPIVELNRQFLDDAELPAGFDESDVVDELDPEAGAVTCWTCGQSVDRATITEQIEAVEAILAGKREERRAVEARIEERGDDRAELEARLERRAELADRRRRLERKIEERERTMTDIEDRLDAAAERIDDLEAALESAAAPEELLDRHRDVSDLAYERGRIERELATVEASIEEREDARAERESLRAERDEVTERLAALRERVDRIEREAVATVNDCLERVLDRLDYDAIERIWIDRREDGGDTVFDLQVVRTGDDGAVYRAAVDTLSKSEREVVGLVIALAGYLVHDVDATVPVVVVDAVEMLDADRIETLLDAFDDHARYVVASALPAEADRLRSRFDAVDLGSTTRGDASAN
jgi:DNA repair exonuclease SbcCD ATPase subunit